jgi:membrane associated rhomboid family serine protease
MIAFSTDVRLKRGAPRAVLGLIVGTFLIHVVFTSFQEFGWITYDKKWDIQGFHLANPDPFQWFLSVLSHGDYWHWFGNMVYLWLFGSILEDRLGSGRFLGLFFLCGACADLLNYVVIGILAAYLGMDMPPARSLGASGAIAGLMGLAMFRFYHARVRVWMDGIPFYPFLRWNIPIGLFAGWWFVKQVFGLLFVPSPVNYLSHIGGFLGGVVAAPLLGFKKQNLEELLWDKAQGLKEEGFHALAAEEFIAQLPRRPDDPEIHREIGECLYHSQSLGRRGREDVRRLALSHLMQAMDLHIRRGEKAEAVELYSRVVEPYRKDIPQDVHDRMRTLSEKGYGAASLVREDPAARLDRLVAEMKERMNAADPVRAYAVLSEIVGMDGTGKLTPVTLFLAAETAARAKDQGLAERLFEQVALKGDEDQTMRALLFLSRAWLKTPRQTRLTDLYRASRERHANIDLRPEWKDLGERLRQ